MDIGQLNGLSSFSNSKALLKHLDPIDYYTILFCTLYQSGVEYFEVDIETLPHSISQNPFWRNKITGYNNAAFNEAYKKAILTLEGKFNHEEDKRYHVKQYWHLIYHLTKIFYAFDTATPFINPAFFQKKDFDLLTTRLDSNLLSCLRNLSAVTSEEQITTLTPQYSILREDVKRFEDICDSLLFQNYSKSLQEIPYSKNVTSLKKDIHVNALKILNKYTGEFSVKEVSFSFLKANKKVVDIFANAVPNIVGDFIINSAEKLTENKRKLYFHEIDEAKFSVLLCRRINEMARQGNEKFKSIVSEVSDELSD